MQTNVEKKVCLLGDWGVGKTSLIRRYVYNAFDDHYLSTLGVKVSKKGFLIKDFKKRPFLKVNLTMLIWDLVGQRGFQYLQASAFKGTNGALVVCDITRPETISAMEKWVSSIFAETKPIPLIFLVNKVDLTENGVPLELKADIEKLVDKYHGQFFPTSAKTGMNVEEAFQTIGKILTRKFFE
ncbi:MAG: GTP-binding protein [Thermoplasmata archaeon]|nr:MAG: GTP-binding protein [Thermoplasmata archaeon]